MSHDALPDATVGKVERFVARLLALIERESDLDAAARMAEWLALYLWENPCGLYRCDRLEELILSRCAQHGAHAPVLTAPSDGELHVASQVFRAGGHTPLMRFLIHGSSRPVAVALTRMTSVDEVASILDVGSDQVLAATGELGPQERMDALVTIMLRYQRVVLHLHPDDVLAAVAVRLAKRFRPGLQVCLVNHADHVFSVGIGVADRVLEISAYGWSLRHKRGTVGQSSFIGLPIPRPIQQRPDAQLPAGGQYILTGGAAYKFKPIGSMSLPFALGRLLAAAPALNLKAIGPGGGDWWWWPLRLRFGKRVELVKAVPKDQYRQYLMGCALYVDSYPWLGGTAFPEALMSGCRVAGLHGVAWGYSHADVMRSDDVASFVRDALALVNGEPSALARLDAERERCIRYHDPAQVRARMDQALDRGQCVEPPEGGLIRSGVETIEDAWRRRGRSVLPPRSRSRLVRSDVQRLAREHIAVFGPMSWASIKLAYYGYFK